MYNGIYIFLKFTCDIDKKDKTYFLIKEKSFFQNEIFVESGYKKALGQ